MTSAILDEAYERFRDTGPEWGDDRLTNHGPMAAEVLVRRGHADQVHRWVDAYLRRLDELPAASDPITDDTWRDALGDQRRIGDWTAYLRREVTDAPWRDVLSTWWPRLLPGIVAGATHGVIRTGHAVRTLLSGDENPVVLDELANGLAFWAARSLAVPGATHPGASVPDAIVPPGSLDPAGAVAALPRIAEQSGPVAHRFGQFAALPGWSSAQAALRAASDHEDAAKQLTELISATTVHYLSHGQASPVLLVHAATAPNAVLRTLPALPTDMWAPSLAAVWSASAAILAAYAPAEAVPRAELPVVEPGPDAITETVELATAHGDEHVIKFADTAADVFARTGEPDALAAAVRVSTLIAAAT
ncbi:MAG TPA: hypothetical protein VH333_20520 [Pseudonocardiaceae bacterium]|jgi:hypothetical protein|nr:hypothetical protein [Pseudonocardiaceae bacterium]